MQDLSLRKSADIEEELALIKAQLNFSNSKLSDSELLLSRISEDHENFHLSNLSSSLIDLKLSEINQKLFPSLADSEKLLAFERVLNEKDFVIKELQGKELMLKKQIERLMEINTQFEVDLQYCVSQNKLAFEEIQELKFVVQEKNEIIEKIKGDGLFCIGSKLPRPNYKLYAEVENVNEENAKLKLELANMNEKNQELVVKISDVQLKYEELLSDLMQLKKSSMNVGDDKKVENLNIEFYRKLIMRIESENKELNSELEFVKVKCSELELLQKKESERQFVKDLINELGVAGEKELYKKVLCLVEIAKQNKDQRQLIQKIASIITKKTGKKEVDLKEMALYITKNLR